MARAMHENPLVPDSTTWPRIASAIRPDPDTERRIDDLLERLSLEEKVGQLIQGEIQYTSPDDVRRFGLGTVLSGGGSFPHGNREATNVDWLELAKAFHEASIQPDGDRTPIPVLWATDAVHGHNNVAGATIFPHAIGLGATRNPELVRQVARCTAVEMVSTGIRCTFSPSVSVARDYRWGRTYESFAQDPALVGTFARAMVEGLQQDADGRHLGEDTVIATLKHYVGDGGTHLGVDRGDTRLNERMLRDTHGVPYFSGLEAGAQIVMASFNAWNGMRVHGHRYLLTTVLKERIGFDGFVIGDWNGHSFVPGCSKDSCAPVFNAGVDVVMAPQDWRPLLSNTVADAESGAIPIERIDDAVRRVLRVKFRAGLFDADWPSQTIADTTSRFGSSEHLDVAAQAVRESLVLLKNRNGLLPLDGRSHVLVAGDAAENLEKQMGGWSMTWQGRSVATRDFPKATTVLDGIRSGVESAGGRLTVAPDGRCDEVPDVAIVVFGEEPYAEWHGDRDTLEFEADVKSWHATRLIPGICPTLNLLRSLKERGIPVVSIFLTGRPMYVNPELNASDAFVVGWWPGSAGDQVAAPLFRAAEGESRTDITGRLPFAWPAAIDGPDDDRWLLPFGFGLGLEDRCELSNDLPEPDVSERRGLRPLNIFSRGFSQPWETLLRCGEESRTVLPTSGHSPRSQVGAVRVDARDRLIQDDAWRITWTGESEASLLLGTGLSLNLDTYLDRGATLNFDALIDAPSSEDIRVEMEGTDGRSAGFSLSDRGGKLATGSWLSVQIPLADFACLGLDMSAIMYPIVLKSAESAVLWVSAIRIELPDDG